METKTSEEWYELGENDVASCCLLNQQMLDNADYMRGYQDCIDRENESALELELRQLEETENLTRDVDLTDEQGETALLYVLGLLEQRTID